MELAYEDYCWDADNRGFRQRDLTVTQTYDRDYLIERYARIDPKVIELARQRVKVLGAFVPVGGRLIDYGCGTGRVVQQAHEAGWCAWGYDIVRYGYGSRTGRGEAECMRWNVACFFDSLEHLTDPDETVAVLNAGWVMVSVPECHYQDSREWFMNWKHRRPGEHLWHWNRYSLDLFFRQLGYRPVMHSTFEDTYRPRYDPELNNILTAIYAKSF